MTDTQAPSSNVCSTDGCFAPLCQVLKTLMTYGDHRPTCTWWKDHRTCTCGWSTEWERIWMPSVAAMRTENAPPDPQGTLDLGAA
ncbi:MAG TPA: hypothetical protein VHB02_06205 [Acidimicrobiales bacterium]|nr:hypothetical protein [Acidimicrobiales bacterium]